MVLVKEPPRGISMTRLINFMENLNYQKYKLDEDVHENILKQIERDVFFGKKSVKKPKIVIFGGQPGAGKSNLVLLSEKDFLNKNVVKINIDEFRKYHPKSKEIFREYAQKCSKFTGPDVRKWTPKIFEKAINLGYNIIFECTMRTEDICDTIKKLKNENYIIEVKVLAVNELISRLAIYQRYENELSLYGAGRFVERQRHDEAYYGMIKTLTRIEIEHGYHKIEVYRRNENLIYSSTTDDSNTSSVESLIRIRKLNWTLDEYIHYTEQADELIKYMTARKEKQEFIDDVQNLKKEAIKMLVL